MTPGARKKASQGGLVNLCGIKSVLYYCNALNMYFCGL